MPPSKTAERMLNFSEVEALMGVLKEMSFTKIPSASFTPMSIAA
jgi:hypothetical protein